MSRFLRFALIAGVLALPLAAAAERHEAVAFDPSLFAQQRAAIEEGLRGDQYREISRQDREAVRAALERIGVALAGKSSLAELRPETRVAVFNDQEFINTTLIAAAEDSRVVCRREKKVGTNFKTNTCMTVAERRRAMEHAQEQMRRFGRAGLPRLQ